MRVQEAWVIDRDGHLVARFAPGDSWAPRADALTRLATPQSRDGASWMGSELHVQVPVRLENERIGTLAIRSQVAGGLERAWSYFLIAGVLTQGLDYLQRITDPKARRAKATNR